LNRSTGAAGTACGKIACHCDHRVPPLRSADATERLQAPRDATTVAEHGFPPLEDLANTLREHLKRAGVDRADLHDDTPTTKRITFHDLRATGITWEALAGTEPLRIMQRAGHTNFSTTQGYIREAEAVGNAIGMPFPELPASLLAAANRLESSLQSSQDDSRSRMRHDFRRNAASPTGRPQL
jgi:hypothetical protein